MTIPFVSLNLRDAGILLGKALDKAKLLTAQTRATWSGDVSPQDSIATSPGADAIEPRVAGDG